MRMLQLYKMFIKATMYKKIINIFVTKILNNIMSKSKF